MLIKKRGRVDFILDVNLEIGRADIIVDVVKRALAHGSSNVKKTLCRFFSDLPDLI